MHNASLNPDTSIMHPVWHYLYVMPYDCFLGVAERCW